jgi:PTS system nitrogen regulatory IIA component
MADESLMSVKELAAYLQVDMSTIYLWSQRGQIPAMKVGNMWRYRRSEIDTWLESRRSQPADPRAADPARDAGS